jgi:glycosyltransferase involved in cell wall biosynthesis
MKILISDQTGGAYGQIDLYRSITGQEGMDVTLLLPARSFDGFTHATKHAEAAGSLRIVTGRSWFANRSHRSVLPALWGLLQRERFDLLYVEAEPESYAALYAVTAHKAVSARCKVALMSWRNIDFPRGVYPFRAAWTHAFAERVTLPRIDGLVAHNGKALELFQSRGIPRTALIPPAVDVERFSPVELIASQKGDEAKKFVIGYVGRFVPEKGLDILLQASARLPIPHEILFVGSGPDEGRLRKESAGLGLAERVRWAGPIASGSLPGIYRGMDVLVLPSRTTPLWKEQFGRVLVEAMACGVPVVGSDSGEIPATIGEAGLTFAEGDAEALAASVRRLSDDLALRKELGEKGRRRAVDNFSLDVAAKMYREFFEKVVG